MKKILLSTFIACVLSTPLCAAKSRAAPLVSIATHDAFFQ